MTRKIEFLKLNEELNVLQKQFLGGVLKIIVVHLHAKASKNTSSFTNSSTCNSQLITIIYCIFSNKQTKHLFLRRILELTYSKWLPIPQLKRISISFLGSRKQN